MMPIGIGLLHGPRVEAHAQPTGDANRPSFEVASVKPNTSGPGPIRVGFPGNGRFNVTNMPLRELIRFAYEVPFQLTGGPGWLDNERFDVNGPDRPLSQHVQLDDALYSVRQKVAGDQVNPLIHAGQKLIPSVTRVFSRVRDLHVFLQACSERRRQRSRSWHM
jgi:hypothetical protein